MDKFRSLFDPQITPEESESSHRKLRAYIDSNTPKASPFWWSPDVGLEGLADRRPADHVTMRPAMPSGKAPAQSDLATKVDRIERQAVEIRERLEVVEDAFAGHVVGTAGEVGA